MRYDYRTIRHVYVVVCLFRRLFFRLRKLAAAHAIGVAFALAVVGTAQAEFEAPDSANLDLVEQHLDDVEWYLGEILSVEQGTNTHQYQTLLQLQNNASILNLIEQHLYALTQAEEPPDSNPTNPSYTLPDWGQIYIYDQWTPLQGLNAGDLALVDPEIEIEPPYDEDGFEFSEQMEWTPPTRNGKTVFETQVDIGPLATVLGMNGTTIDLSTDLDWYDGPIRSALHAAIIAFLAFVAGYMIFEEFRRYA
jgi:hypothetical protein